MSPRIETQQSLSNGLQQYVRLENRLVLLAWLNRLLGYKSNRALLEDCKTVAEGFGAGSSVASVQPRSKAKAAHEVGGDASGVGHGFVDGNVAGKIGFMNTPKATQKGAQCSP